MKLLNLKRNRRNITLQTTVDKLNSKMSCMAVRKLTNIKLGTNIPSGEEYYTYMRLKALNRILDGVNCESPCYDVCVDDVVNLINETLYKIC